MDQQPRYGTCGNRNPIDLQATAEVLGRLASGNPVAIDQHGRLHLPESVGLPATAEKATDAASDGFTFVHVKVPE